MPAKQESRFQEIELVCFDVGGTLLHPWPSVGEIYSREAAQFGIAAEPRELQRRFKRAFYAAQERARAAGGLVFGRTEEEARRSWRGIVAESFGAAAHAPGFADFFAGAFEFFAHQQAYSLYPDALPVLEHLHRRKIRTGLLSNWDGRLHTILRELRLHRLFDPLVLSCEVGCEKPARAIFDHAAQRAGVEPRRILHVGDGLEDDYQGALNAGWRALLLDRRQKFPDPQLNRIESLFELIENYRSS